MILYTSTCYEVVYVKDNGPQISWQWNAVLVCTQTYIVFDNIKPEILIVLLDRRIKDQSQERLNHGCFSLFRDCFVWSWLQQGNIAWIFTKHVFFQNCKIQADYLRESPIRLATLTQAIRDGRLSWTPQTARPSAKIWNVIYFITWCFWQDVTLIHVTK